jgi:hypothetical protein
MSHWDKLELFSAADAASLVTGDDKSETKALLNQMRDAYENAVGETFTKHFEIRHPHSQANPKPVRYHSITDPLPEGLLYSRALDMQSGLLFRPDPEEVSCKFFNEWHGNHTDRHHAFSCNFDVQKFDRNELQRWLAFHKIDSSYSFVQAGPPAAAHPPSPEPLDLTVLEIPAQLLRAFERTGLKKGWFNEPSKHPWLLAARKQPGRGGNTPAAPLYCPYEVMIGLTTKIRPRDGGVRLSREKGFQLLKRFFPAVYEKFEFMAPDDDQS